MRNAKELFWEQMKDCEGICLDVDDTVCDSNCLIKGQMDLYIARVAEDSGIGGNIVKEVLVRANNSMFEKYAVQPERWYAAAELAGRELGCLAIAMSRADILLDIYKQVPEIFPETKPFLIRLKKDWKKIALVTHAPQEWNTMKVQKWGIEEYVDVIEVVDVSRPKGAGDYLRAVKQMGLSPKRCGVIGDNLRGDICAGEEAGMTCLVWIKSKWSVYASGEVPNGTIVIRQLGELLGNDEL